MKLVADIHLHSHYSRATSRNLTLEHLWKWAQIKGVQVVATGDIAHPGWLAELRDKLEPAEAGLFQLKREHAEAMADQVPAACRGTVRFLIGGEISNIYKKYDRTRKVHNIVFAPSLDATARLQAELEKIGNIRSDGRPILGLDSRDLLEIVLAVDDRCHLIPAHIWTPWFSILGSKSGFDSVEECYADLTPHIFAVETGLSSDPPMNWRVSWLDDYTLISSSDAHSPQKLAREATCFDTELSYDALFGALRGGDRHGYRGTIEFFPEEGKYHMDGHRKCGVCWEPAATRAHGGRCSACGKPVTVGVYHRMEELADRPPGARPPAAGPFASLVPLPEALSELLGVGPGSKRVQREYHRLVERLGPELAILQEVPLEEIDACGGAVLAEGIRRMRAGEVRAQGGYDGEYGVIRLFDGEADRSAVVQLGMFDEPTDAEAGTGRGAVAEATAPPSAPSVRCDAQHSDRFRAKAVAKHGGASTATVGRQDTQPSPDSRATGVAEGGGAPSASTAANEAARGSSTGTAAPIRESEPERPPAALERSTENTRQPEAAPPTPRVSTSAPKPAAQSAHAAPRASERHPWLTGLNPAQGEAATHTSSPLAIVAGPGTGKTRTLTVRIAHLVRALGADPASILVLTFTHKAADELRERLDGLLPRQVAERITAGTFHQLGARLLEEFGAAAGIPRPFAIFDEADRRALLKQCSPALSAGQLRAALLAISASKNGVTAATAAANTQLPDPATLRARYDEALAAAGALDLDDLVARTVDLLERNEGVRRTLQRRYRWLSVDEYQDVNAAQYRLLRLLADGGANLCVIGDPDQAIYGFRGADHRYFLSFGGDFPGAETLRLDRNYRSAQAILSAAGQVIAHNPGYRATALTADHAGQPPGAAGDREHPRTAVGATTRPSHPEPPASRDAGDREHGVGRATRLSGPAAPVKLDVYRAPTDRAEAEYVVHQVERMVGGTSYFSLDSGRVVGDDPPEARSFADFAVLYRLNAQARLLEEAFDRSGIPYQTAGATPLAEQPPVREVLALLWLTEAPTSHLHWRRVLLDGAGAATEAELSRFLAGLSAGGDGGAPQTPPRNPASMTAAGEVAATVSADARPDADKAPGTDSATTPGVTAQARAAAGPPRGLPVRALQLVGELTGARHTPVADRVQAAAAGWAALRGRGYNDAERERLARLQQRAAAAHVGMREFLTAAALQSETDRYDERADRVALMSLHAAKGLEFPVVFIVGCEEGLLPYRPPHRAADPGEERRLCYVGMTRARHRLILTHAARRVLFGQRLVNPISGFVTDIEAALRAAGQAHRRPRQPKPEDLQLPLF